ncbi:TetR/AcrR family transcriptional regulator [Nocardioides sp.]|uniref:TetR/AcrR family transcriptional regulator n=1 Tax=Nocardioides sp. TaxID=35761 RepID=UPI0025F2464B|nr:TetR/AcrR family transcriptional regulator [Nocardioides sp.]
MAEQGGRAPSAPWQEVRKAATRARILEAGRGLFAERGYAGTSIGDISEAAGVGVRTIYLHFPSKAAIMLAYFDGWLDAFVAAVRERPVEEPVAETVAAALAAMADAGWVDRAGEDVALAYPFLEQLTVGSLDIAGHVMQRWMAAIADLVDDATARAADPDPTRSQARASALFAAWVANMAAVHASKRGAPLPEGASGNSNGLEILRLMTGGELAQ